MSPIYISFSNTDRHFSDSIVASIKYYGAEIWYQTDNSKHNNIPRANNAFKASVAFVCLVSHNSLSSIRVRNEVNRAILESKRRKDYKILPIIIGTLNEQDEELLSLLMGSYPYIELSSFPDEHALALKLFEQIGLTPSLEREKASLYSGIKEVEVYRIAQQNTIYNEYANRHLDRVFLKFKAPDVLDVGCSDGKNINLRLQGRSYHSLIGIDIDSKKIEQAIIDHPDNRQTFICMDVASDDFIEKMQSCLAQRNQDGFDIIHISSVLLHLKDPGEVLSRLRSFLRPKGLLFIQEEDDGLNLSYPHADFFQDAFYLWEHSLESGDRFFARKLPKLLKKSGYRNIRLLSTTITSLDFGNDRLEAFWDLYFNIDLWSADSPEFFNNYDSLLKLKQYHKVHQRYKKAFMKREYFVSLGIFFFIAGK